MSAKSRKAVMAVRTSELDPRKLRILSAIVETYIATGEPIGSKLVARLLDGEVSPATIRNEMAVLFDQGLLEQPHTSAGRVPSHLGYRLYLDQLMRQKPLTGLEKQRIEALFNLRDPDPDRLLEDAAKALAELTGCAVISTATTKESARVRRIELIPATSRTVVILLIASNGMVKNKVCRVDFVLTPKILEFFQNFANRNLAGRSINDISSSYLSSVAVGMGEEYMDIFTPLFSAIFELCRECSDGQIYRSGTANLLEHEELRQVANQLFRVINSREAVMELIDRGGEGIQVFVGKENPNSAFAGSSVIISKYHIGRDNTGAMGLIGPIRMDYARLIPHLEYFSQTLGRLLGETLEEQK